MTLAADLSADQPTYSVPQQPKQSPRSTVTLAVAPAPADRLKAPDAPQSAPRPDRPGTPTLKRVFDICFAILTLPAVLPVIAVIWGAVRLDGGPGFFGHKRIGRDGRDFTCWKLRSMCLDADARLEAYLQNNPDAADEWARSFKLSRDPRITRLGRFLRASSLDELPQVWNVLRGDMSFVGPRPVPALELRMYGRAQKSYLALRPGITGLWQVSGRNDVSYSTRIAMDVLYRRNASVWLDIKIIFLTFAAVLRRTGT